jgi:ADP-heptose:LPS heptosyltransferase
MKPGFTEPARLTRFRHLARLITPVLRPPFSSPIPLDLGPVSNKPALSLAWRRVRPALSLGLRAQTHLQRPFIDRGMRRVLWIYKGSPQIGDSLMDLASRVMLAARGCQVDLCTDPHLAELYRADDVFRRVFSDAGSVTSADYDLVILDSFKWRCLEVKFRHFSALPYVTMRGYFAGPEFNRTLFSFFRMNQLLETGMSDAEVHSRALPHLVASDADREAVAELRLPADAVAFAIGGAAPGRTYRHWQKVIVPLLQRHPGLSAVLLGSRNATAMRDAILHESPAMAYRIVDLVDRCTLLQSFEVLRGCILGVAADGGLLHMANAAGIPTVSLFDSQISPALRLTTANRSISLRSSGDMSAIAPSEVLHCIEQAIARDRSS